MSTNTLLHITRLNWLASDEEERWNTLWRDEVMPSILARPGVIRGARYKLINGPGYVGWDGPSRAFQYLHILELEDSELGSAFPVTPFELGRAWSGGRPSLDKLLGVAGVYRRMSGRGEVGFTPLLYATRYEIRPPEEKENWNRFYDDVVRGQRIFSREGIGAGARFVLQRGPEYVGWLGPEGSSLYFNLYEVLGDEWVDKVMPPIETIQQWSATEPFGLQNLNEVRAVYRRL